MKRIESQIQVTSVQIGDLIKIEDYKTEESIVGHVDSIMIASDVYITRDRTTIQNLIRFHLLEENSKELKFSIFFEQDDFVSKVITFSKT